MLTLFISYIPTRCINLGHHCKDDMTTCWRDDLMTHKIDAMEMEEII